MNAGLWRLLALETRGQVRSVSRRMVSPRGLALLLAFAAIAWFLAIASLSPGIGLGGSRSDAARSYGPIVMWVFVVMGWFSPKGLYFKPAEVAHLFPAPIGRRELVLFNVITRARVAVLSAAFLALMPSFRASSLANAFTAYTLLLLFTQVSAQWMAVFRSWLEGHERIRSTLLVGLVAAIAWFATTRDLSPLAPLLSLTRPFIETLLADSLLQALPSLLASAAIVVVAIASLCVLDVAYLESALRVSRRSAERRARVRAGGFLSTYASNSRRRVPRLPHLLGAGPIAWEKLTEAIRNPRGVGLLLFIVLLGAGSAIFSPFRDAASEGEVRGSVHALIGVFTIFSGSILIGDNLALDFRRDLDRMPILKSLPLTSPAISAGQIAAATCLVSFVQWIGIAIVAVVTAALPLVVVLGILLVLPLANWTTIAIENAIYLTFPYRIAVDDPADVSFIGRTMLAFVAKIAIVATVCGSAFAFGWLAYGVSSWSLLVAGIAVVFWLAAACVPLTLLVARAFDRFDVARDLPS